MEKRPLFTQEEGGLTVGSALTLVATVSDVDGKLEEEAIALLVDIQSELHNAFGHLQGKQTEGPLFYQYYSDRMINEAIMGYIVLRNSGQIPASKILIRTALEAAFRLTAVQKKPELLFRIIYSEMIKDKKLIAGASEFTQREAKASIEGQWEEYKKDYAALNPSLPMQEVELNIFETAKAAGLIDSYNLSYRTYCQFSHATFRVMAGAFDSLDHHDTPTLCQCGFIAMLNLSILGAPVPRFDEVMGRYEALTEKHQAIAQQT